MTTKLEGDLRREFLIGQDPYTLTISPKGFVLALKGRRKGLEVAWADLVSGDAAMATALNASLSANIQPKAAKPGPVVPKVAKATMAKKRR
jgi:hypothetical protein